MAAESATIPTSAQRSARQRVRSKAARAATSRPTRRRSPFGSLTASAEISVGRGAVGAVEVERRPAAARGDGGRPVAEVAGDAAAVGVDEEVDGVAVGRVLQPLADAGGERGRAAAGEVVGEAAELGLDHRLLLGVDHPADAPVERAEHQRGRDRDEHEVRGDEAHGGVAEHPRRPRVRRGRRACSPSRARCG